MTDDVEWIVPRPPVRDADRSARAVGLALPASERRARVADLRRQVADGIYVTELMMDAVARRILRSGDL
jgi:hypothetical protein